VLSFDQQGNLLKSWGGKGQGYDWPDSNHGITIDYKGNVWIGGNGRGPASGRGALNGQDEELATGRGAAGRVDSFADNMVLKFTQEGKFLLQIGKPKSSKGSNDVENLRLPAKTFVDPKTNELYVRRGYGNHRVIVFDAETGKYKRHWGAYGHKPDDAGPRQVRSERRPSAAVPQSGATAPSYSNDNLLYVCDRVNDRIQVFHPDGTYVKEMFIEKETLARARPGTSRFRKIPSRSTFISPTARTIAFTSSTGRRSKS